MGRWELAREAPFYFHSKPPFAESSGERLAGLSVAGATDHLAFVIFQDRIAASQHRQWADCL